MALQIVNRDPKYARVALIEPATRGYLFVAAEVHPRRVPFAPNSHEKAALLAQLREIVKHIEYLDAVEKVTIFDAIVFAPPSAYVRERAAAIRIPRFDIVVLIETHSPAAARDVRAAPEFHSLLETLRGQATSMHVIAARNAKRIRDVDKTRKGLFLFNYFVGDNPDVVLQLWDYLAGWYAVETGLDNSTLFVPMEGERSDYVAINNARWDKGLLMVLLPQVSKKSFRTYMQANMEANHVGAMPILYRVVNLPAQPTNIVPSWVLPVGSVLLGAAVALTRITLRRLRRAALVALTPAVNASALERI